MPKNLNVIVYPTVSHDPLAKYTWNTLDQFYLACGSSREGVIKFIRGTHKNYYYDSLKEKNGKWPSIKNECWMNIPLGELIYKAYFGSQNASKNLIKRL